MLTKENKNIFIYCYMICFMHEQFLWNIVYWIYVW